MRKTPNGRHELSAWQWCKLARGADKARPILCGVYYSGSANGSVLAATDGHRLHVAPHKPYLQLPQGVYDTDDLAGIDGKYPNYDQVLQPVQDVIDNGWRVTSWSLLNRALRGAIAFWKATGSGWNHGGVVNVPVNGKPEEVAYVHPQYLWDALAGMGEDTRLWLPGPLQPLQLCDLAGRRAAVMPVRMSPAELTPEPDPAEATLVVQNAEGGHLNLPSLRVPLQPYLVAPSG